MLQAAGAAPRCVRQERRSPASSEAFLLSLCNLQQNRLCLAEACDAVNLRKQAALRRVSRLSFGAWSANCLDAPNVGSHPHPLPPAPPVFKLRCLQSLLPFIGDGPAPAPAPGRGGCILYLAACIAQRRGFPSSAVTPSTEDQARDQDVSGAW